MLSAIIPPNTAEIPTMTSITCWRHSSVTDDHWPGRNIIKTTHGICFNQSCGEHCRGYNHGSVVCHGLKDGSKNVNTLNERVRRDRGHKRGFKVMKAITDTFLWQQQSSAERADKMTVLAINTSSKIIKIRLKLIWKGTVGGGAETS